MNPFDLPGPAFLALYLTVLAGAVVVALVARWLLRTPADDPPVETFDLSAYELAYLACRDRRVIDAAIVRLIHRGALALDTATGQLSRRDSAPPTADAIEKSVLGATSADQGKHINEVHRLVGSALGKLRDRLEVHGLVVAPAQGNRVCLASAGAVALAGLFGLVKLFVGLERHRPVGFLLVLLGVTAIIAVVFLFKRPFRSRRGDALLSQLKSDNAALEYAAARRGTDLADDDLLLAMGLFGLGVLASGPLAKTYTALQAAQARAAHSALSSTNATSCGGACAAAHGGGCGGGGCGGGCGGGGCGGCGG